MSGGSANMDSVAHAEGGSKDHTCTLREFKHIVKTVIDVILIVDDDDQLPQKDKERAQYMLHSYRKYIQKVRDKENVIAEEYEDVDAIIPETQGLF